MEGRGLHTGRVGRVALEKADGPTTLGCAGERATLRALRIEGRDRCSVAVFPSGREILTVEHLLSAIVGASVFEGLHVELEGDEVPLLDGGAARFFDAVSRFPAAGPCAIVTRRAEIVHDGTTLVLTPAEATDVEVHVDFPATRFGRELHGAARWLGDRESFRSTIAPARTFGAASELASLRACGLAAHIEPGSVVGLDVDDVRFAARDPDEPIRHKLLDALGDLAALGGALRGRLSITRPSHRGTRGAVMRAVESGVLALE